jgi:hypothetical protein
MLMCPDAGESAGDGGGGAGAVTMTRAELDQQIASAASKAAREAATEASAMAVKQAVPAALEAHRKQEADSRIAAKKQRIDTVKAMFGDTPGISDLCATALADEKIDANEFDTKAKAIITGATTPIPQFAVSMGATSEERKAAGVEMAILAQTGASVIAQIQSMPDRVRANRAASKLGFADASALDKAYNEFQASGLQGQRLHTVLEASLTADGRSRFYSVDRTKQFQLLASMGTSNLPQIFENVINKTWLGAFELASVVYDRYCKIGRANDFKEAKTYSMSNFEQLSRVPEFGRPSFIYVGERAVGIRPEKWMGEFGFSIEAWYDDDLGALTELPVLAQKVAAMMPDIFAAGLLNTAAATAFSGGANVFSAARRNLASVGASITPATLADARTGMIKQRDFAGGATGLPVPMEPNVVLVPPDLYDPALRATKSPMDYSFTGSQGDKPINTVQGLVQPVVSQFFGSAWGGSDTAWTLVNNVNLAPFMQLNFLEGKRAGVIMKKPQTTMTQMNWEIMIAFGGTYVAPEAAYRNPGA